MNLTGPQKAAHVAQLKGRIPKDPVRNGRIRDRKSIRAGNVEYGVDIMNSTTPPKRSRWIVVGTDTDNPAVYWDEDFGQIRAGWIE